MRNDHLEFEEKIFLKKWLFGGKNPVGLMTFLGNHPVGSITILDSDQLETKPARL